MQLRTYSSEGIVLARRNFGEADRIVSMYSKDRGRVSLLAKGIRRPKSRKRGHLESFSLIKFSATDSRGIGILTEAETQNNFDGVRKSLPKVTLAYYICEVVGKITHESERNTELFDLINKTLGELENTNRLKELRYKFMTKLLVLLGFWPEGKEIQDPDSLLEEVIERKIGSARVGKRMLE
jgi:DNA repair protein RecO (recombination protein O)